MRIRHAVLLIATAFLVGACGSGSSTLGSTNTQSGNGATGAVHPLFRPLFQVGQGILPYPTDLFLNGSVDGTLKAPVLAVTPNVGSLNSLDGFGVNTEMTIRFSKKVDPATLAAPGSIVILETVQRTVVASASSIARVPVGVRRVLVPGVDYSVGLSTASDADGTVVSIKPLKPLTPSTGGIMTGAPTGLVDQSGVGYVVIVTNAVKSVDGDLASADDEYALIRQAVYSPTDPSNPASNCDSVGNVTLAGVCRLTAPQLAIAQAAHIPSGAIALTFSFTTESTRDTLVQMANAVLSGPAPALAARVLQNPVTGVDLTDKDILDPAHQIPELLGVANVFEGTITLPYYQATPADASAGDPAPSLTGQWQAGNALSLVPGKTGSTRITRYNPLPAARHTMAVPVMITVPNNTPRPEAGWPVVIFVHGITRNRSDMLALSEAYAEAGYAVAAKLGANTFLFNRMFGDAQAAVDAGDPLNHIALATANKPILLHKVVNDQVVPNSSTDRLIALSGLQKQTTRGFWPGGSYVTFTAGGHGSLLDESIMPQVTVEMQEEFAAFAFLNGSGFEILDDTYIQNP